MPQTKSLKEHQSHRRERRRERTARRNQELLNNALKKVKNFLNDNDKAVFENLEESIAKNFPDNNQETDIGQIQTSVSEQDILNDAVPKEPEKSEAPATQSAKNRFKQALLKGGIKNVDDEKTESDTSKNAKNSKNAGFNFILEERKRLKKMILNHLTQTGKVHSESDVQTLVNKLTDIYLLNFQATTPKYTRAVKTLKQRETLPIRTGNNQINYTQNSNPQKIVGDVFSNYNIDKGKSHIILNPFQEAQGLKIPSNNFDSIRENLIKELLFDNTQNRSDKLPFIDNEAPEVLEEDYPHQKPIKIPDYEKIRTNKNIRQEYLEKQFKIRISEKSHNIEQEARENFENTQPYENQKTVEENKMITNKKPSIPNIKLQDLIKNNKKTQILAGNQNVNQLKSRLQKLIIKNNNL